MLLSFVLGCGVSPAIAAPVSTGAAPSAVILPDSAVIGTVSVALTPTEALRRLADPVWVTEVEDGGTRASVSGRDGDCLLVDYVVPSVVMTLNYTVRQCPTGHGYRSTLVRSDDLSSYEAEWSVVPAAAGSTLTWKIRLTPAISLPESLISSSVRRSAERMMQRFLTVLGPA